MPGIVDAMTIQPISVEVAWSDCANSGNTGVFDSVELKMASPPMSAMRTKKEGRRDFIKRQGVRFAWLECSGKWPGVRIQDERE